MYTHTHTHTHICIYIIFPSGTNSKDTTCQYRRLKRCGFNLGWEDTLEKDMAAQSSILAWKIQWTQEPGVL